MWVQEFDCVSGCRDRPILVFGDGVPVQQLVANCCQSSRLVDRQFVLCLQAVDYSSHRASVPHGLGGGIVPRLHEVAWVQSQEG